MISFLKRILFSFGLASYTHAAISWTDGVVRAIVLNRNSKRVHIVSYKEIELPVGAIMGGDIQDSVSLLAALGEIKKSLGIYKYHILLPEEQAYVFHTRTVRMFKNADRTIIEDHLKAFLATHDVLRDGKYSCEYDIIDSTPEALDLHVSVLPNKYVDVYRNIVERAGLRPLSLEVGMHQVSMHCKEYLRGGVILVEFGKNRTVVSLSNQGRIIDRSIHQIGYSELVGVIKRFLGVSDGEAMRILESYGLLQLHPENGLLSELLLSLSPITRSIDLLIRSHLEGPYRPAALRFRAEHIVIYGSGSWVKGLEMFFQIRSRLPASFLRISPDKILPENMMMLPAGKVLSFAPLLALTLAHSKE